MQLTHLQTWSLPAQPHLISSYKVNGQNSELLWERARDSQHSLTQLRVDTQVNRRNLGPTERPVIHSRASHHFLLL